MKTQKLSTVIIGMIIIVWVSLSIGGYYVYHKPFSPEIGLSIGIRLFEIGIAVSIFSIAGAIGKLLISIESHDNRFLEWSIQTAAGFGILSLFLLVFGSTIGFNSKIAWILFLVFLFILRKPVFSWLKQGVKALNEVFFEQHNEINLRVIVFGAKVILLLTLVNALVPPTKFDSLVYHLYLPRVYLDQGSMRYIHWNMFWGMPQIAEMVYTWGMGLGGVQIPLLINWLIGFITLIGLFSYLKDRFDKQIGWIAIVVILSGYTFVSELSWGYVEWFTICFGFCAFVYFEKSYTSSLSKYIIIAGFFAGLALGTKYTAGIVFLSGFVVLIWQYFRKKHITFLTFISYVGVVILTSSPWWIKNFVATGNPLYPFFFPSGSMDTIRLDLYQNYPIFGSWQDAYLLPWRSTLFGFDIVAGYGASIGPLWIALGVLSWLNWQQRSLKQKLIIENATVFVIVGYVIWAIGGRLSGFLIQSRLYFSIFPAYAILAGSAFVGIKNYQFSGIRLGRVILALIIMVFYFNIFEVVIATLKTGVVDVLLEEKTEEAYLDDNLGMYIVAMRAINELPIDSKVLMLWEARGFYCVPKCFPDETLDRWKREIHKTSDPDEIIKNWQAQGYTHILFYRSGADFVKENDIRYADREWALLEKVFDQLNLTIDLRQVYELYKLR